MIPRDYITEWRGEAPWDFEDALEFVLDVFVSRLAGEPWRTPKE